MALTLNQLVDACSSVVGEDSDPRFPHEQICNEAGRYLFDMHPWTWRVRPTVPLDFVTNQPYLTLPSDFGFGIIDDLVMANNLVMRIQLTTLGELAFIKATTPLSIALRFWAALVYPRQNSPTDGMPTPRLELYPVPQAGQTGAVIMTYRSAWWELSQPSQVANIPTAFESLLIRVIRAKATAYKTGDYTLQDAIYSSPEFDRMMKADSLAQADLGRMGGGILDDYGRTWDYGWNFTPPTSP